MDINQELTTELLTEREAATFLRLCPRGLINWRNTGKIPYLRIGRSIRYRRASLIALVEKLEKGGN
jgi:hypothetical protein